MAVEHGTISGENMMKISTMLATAALTLASIGATTAPALAEPARSAAGPAAAADVHLLAPYRVVPWHNARVRQLPTTRSPQVDYVTANDGYDAYCWIHGENIEGNDIWVRQLGDNYKQGYVAAYYLKGGVTGNVGTKCS